MNAPTFSAALTCPGPVGVGSPNTAAAALSWNRATSPEQEPHDCQEHHCKAELSGDS